MQLLAEARASARWTAALLAASAVPLRLGVDVQVKPTGDARGAGVFAKRPLPKGALLERYAGTMLRDDNEEQFLESRYLMALERGWFVDGSDAAKSSWCRYVNHSKRRQNCEVYLYEAGALGGENPILDKLVNIGPPIAYLETIRDIKPGEELLISYGDEYWDALVGRFNIIERLKIDYLS